MTWLDVHHKTILNFEDLLVVPSSHNNQDAICLWIQRDEPDEHSKYLDKASNTVITREAVHRATASAKSLHSLLWWSYPRPAPSATNNPCRGGGGMMGQRGTSCLRCHILGLRSHILVSIGRQYGSIVPAQHHQPPITHTGGGMTGQRGKSYLRCHILVYMGRQYGPIVPGQHHWPPITPTGGHDGTWDKRGTSSTSWHIYTPKENLALPLSALP